MPRRIAVERRLAFIVVLAAAGSAAHSQPPLVQPFVVTEPKAVQAAEMLCQEVQALAKLVTPCIDSGKGTPVECACRFPTQRGWVQRSAKAVK
jgi:hypothetical protein